ncbi:MAG: type III-A CRISPR-associated RAMP protein Csm4 [Firmicutes bacterium]|nr:type III-A CRISPR-associated RAMP protein Csm4 [Bacillota bacterium]
MDYYIYRLKFKTPVHFGNGRLNGSIGVIYADTLFSALCCEAVSMYGKNGAEKLYNAVNDGKMLISDTMPYADTLYLPKPMTLVESNEKGDSSLKKKFKNLKYIPVNDLNDYLSGGYIPKEIEFGKDDIRVCVRVNEEEDSEPFDIGIYDFLHNENEKQSTGLYFIAGLTDDFCKTFDELMTSLSYSGIGGKRSSGYGKFDFEKTRDTEFTDRIKGKFKTYMSLSVSMTDGEELKNVIPNASYELIRRSGFVFSEDYSDDPLKKRDMYCFKGGACFDTRFDGKIFDVSDGGAHPVYRYAKPLLFGIK